MLLHAELGDRGAALHQYQLCVSALSRELRAEPEAETKALYREILQRRLAPPPLAAPPSSGAAETARQDPLPATGPPQSESPLVGRGFELGRLRDALQAAWTGRTRLVAVIGEAGIGKSRLAAELGEEVRRTGGRVLVGHCHGSEQVLPFRAVDRRASRGRSGRRQGDPRSARRRVAGGTVPALSGDRRGAVRACRGGCRPALRGGRPASRARGRGPGRPGLPDHREHDRRELRGRRNTAAKCTVSRNIASNNDDDGIDVGGSKSLVTLNRTDDNFDVGTRVGCPSTVTNNRSSGNLTPYVFDGAGCITSNNQ